MSDMSCYTACWCVNPNEETGLVEIRVMLPLLPDNEEVLMVAKMEIDSVALLAQALLDAVSILKKSKAEVER